MKSTALLALSPTEQQPVLKGNSPELRQFPGAALAELQDNTRSDTRDADRTGGMTVHTIKFLVLDIGTAKVSL